MFGAGPDEPPWPVVAACDGWFVVCMIGASADGPTASAEIPSTNPIVFERVDSALHMEEHRSNVEISKAFPACQDICRRMLTECVTQPDRIPP